MFDINEVINSLNPWWALAYILSLGVLGFLGFYTKVKDAELVKDLLGIRERYNKQLKIMLDSNLLTQSEKVIFEYDLLKLKYEKLLKLKGEALPVLQKLQSYENVLNAVFLYKSCRYKYRLTLNRETNNFETTINIDNEFKKRAKAKIYLGVILSILISFIGITLLLLISIYIIKNIILIKSNIISSITVILLLCIYSIIFFILGGKIFSLFLSDTALIYFINEELDTKRIDVK